MSKLFNDDCMRVLPTLADESVNMVLTDIPYGFAEYFGATAATNADAYNGRAMRNLNKGVADAITFALPAFSAELVRVCSGSIYVFCGLGQVSELGSLFIREGLKIRLGIWEKTRPKPPNGSAFLAQCGRVLHFCEEARRDLQRALQIHSVARGHLPQ